MSHWITNQAPSCAVIFTNIISVCSFWLLSLFTYLSTYLSTCHPACPVCLPTYLPACLPICLPTYLSAILPVYRCCLSTCLPIYLPIYISIVPSLYHFTFMSACSICLPEQAVIVHICHGCLFWPGSVLSSKTKKLDWVGRRIGYLVRTFALKEHYRPV